MKRTHQISLPVGLAFNKLVMYTIAGVLFNPHLSNEIGQRWF